MEPFGASLLPDLILLLAVSGILVPLFQRFSVSPILAYLLAGILVGPHGFALLFPDTPWITALEVDHTSAIRLIGDMGVVFLLFIIGLELPASRLWQMRRQVLGLGGLQLTATTLVIGSVAYAFGNSLAACLLIGGAMAMSSTAIVMQLLSQRHETAQPLGRACFSILLLQDLAVVPLLVLTGFLASGSAPLPALMQAIGKGLLALLIIAACGTWLLRPLFRLAARAVGEESFLALALLAAVGTAFLTGLAGLSMTLGAFLAGMLLAETEYSRAIDTYIAPFKGLLMGAFFISVGIGLDLSVVVDDLPWLAVSLPGLFLVKAGITGSLARAFGLNWRTAGEAGILLGQAGEFAFVILGLAVSRNVIPTGDGQFMLALAALSMLATPPAAGLAKRLLARLPETPLHAPQETLALEGHVVIAGFGRVGRMVAEVLEAEGVPWVALDTDSAAVAAAHARNLPVWFGDARHKAMLERLHIGNARGVVIAAGNGAAAEAILANIQQHWAGMPIALRTRDRRHARTLSGTSVRPVPENLELGLQLAAMALRSLDVQEDAIQHRLALARTIGERQ